MVNSSDIRNMLIRLFPLLLGVTVVLALLCRKFYRKDYTYLEQFDAFYKLHWDPGQSWGFAFLSCDEEGATLFYPKTSEEWVVAKTLIARMKDPPNVTDIFIGIHDKFGWGEFMTVDGLSTPSPLPDRALAEANGQSTCVAMDIDSGNYKMESCEAGTVKPFVCKKVEEPIPSCPTIDRGYVYNKDIMKCFKISKRQKTWTEAMQTCIIEGGILAVITKSEQSHVICNMLKNEEEHIPRKERRGMEDPIFVGFRRLYPDSELYTVKGQQYDDSFPKVWKSTMDNGGGDKNYDCGVVYKWRDGFLVTATRNCTRPARFVCEMDVQV